MSQEPLHIYAPLVIQPIKQTYRVTILLAIRYVSVELHFGITSFDLRYMNHIVDNVNRSSHNLIV